VRNALAAAGVLITEGDLVHPGLLDPHLRPGHIEFFGHQHRQGGAHALADLRATHPDGDRAAGIDAHEGIRRERGRHGGVRPRARSPGQAGLHQQRAAYEHADAAELAPRERRRRAGPVAGRAFPGIAALRGRWVHRWGDGALIVKTVTRARRLARFGLSLIRLGRSQRR